MSDAKNPFQDMIQAAQDMVKSINPALETFSPKGFEAMWPTMPKEVMEMYFGNAFNKDGLDAKNTSFAELGGFDHPRCAK